MRVKQKILLFTLHALTLIGALMMLNSDKAEAVSCSKLEVIYVRGSGQSLGSHEFLATKEQFNSYIQNDIQYKELGDGSKDMGTYPAVAVDQGNILNAFDAKIEWPKVGKYKDSIKAGVDSLIFYLQEQSNRCPSSKSILFGYSQGAQVIGDTLNKASSSPFFDNIAYVGLFGDPKFTSRANSSVRPFWLRINKPETVEGILNGRDPYMPSAFTDKSSSWCYFNDGICGGGIEILDNRVHTLYAIEYIPRAVQEAVSILHSDPEMNDSMKPRLECGAPKQDIILAIDMNPTMRQNGIFADGEYQKTQMDSLLRSMYNVSCNTRIGVVGFWPTKDNKPARPLMDFTSNPADIRQTLSAIYEPGNHTTRSRTRISQGLQVALSMQWRPDAIRQILVWSNSVDETWRPVDPFAYQESINAYISSSNIRDLAKQAQQKQIGVYNWFGFDGRNYEGEDFVAGYAYLYWLQLATLMGASEVTPGCAVGGCFSYLRNMATSAVQVSVNPTRAKVGETVTLNANDLSLGLAQTLRQQNRAPAFEWDLDCDGTFESGNGTTPNVTFTAERAQNCQAVIRANTYHNHCYYCGFSLGIGRLITASYVTTFPLVIVDDTQPAPAKPGAIKNLTKTWTNEDSITYRWEPPENTTEELVYLIRDDAGEIIGATKQPRFSIVDITYPNEPIITINAVSESGQGTQLKSDSVGLAYVGFTPEGKQDTSVPLASSQAQQVVQKEYGFTVNQAMHAPANASGYVYAKQPDSEVFYAKNDASRELFTQPKKLSPNEPLWLNFTIVAVPLALATAMGLLPKFGVTLSLKTLTFWRRP